jgi:hypothetical protein
MTARSVSSNVTIPQEKSTDHTACVFNLFTSDLAEVEKRVLSIVQICIENEEECPSAADIKAALVSAGFRLGRSQLYQYLKTLQKRGFLVANAFSYPRRFLMNDATLAGGIKDWIRTRKNRVLTEIVSLEEDLETLGSAEPEELALLFRRELSRCQEKL